jgi:hypothetical protein
MLQFDIDNRWPHAPMQKAPVAPPGFSLRAGFFIDHMGPASVGGLFHFKPSVQCRLLALNGRADRTDECLLLGE